MSGYASAFGWCSCPYCPSNGSAHQSYPLRYLSSVPYYDPGHQHQICEWCNVWQRLGPGFALANPQELLTTYQKHIHTFESIHDFFRGAALAPDWVAIQIRRVAEYIDLNAAGMAWRQLALDLYELASDVGYGDVMLVARA
ncbi:hypothetical protein M409DRAFT_20925 [Zasmidium cellare ATCC 36951]|uniref:Uncharacterized protein n=1 Tax=Zasmidium cellare ATCC 36951 TaxID=1080233 RepID=A0A6A6CQF8_ZASCE|nr:uncharacterized protein M409DRAFT_20925 [Zasmidium cellare ATCC 36951]KAF2168913.1 hypothetical protein M409DRAFT_20925 [Zasmidium cellare ATCC 36951]